MAQSMHLKVIAEGVETPVEADFLRTKRCGEMQGFLISRPLALEQAESFLIQHMGVANDLERRQGSVRVLILGGLSVRTVGCSRSRAAARTRGNHCVKGDKSDPPPSVVPAR